MSNTGATFGHSDFTATKTFTSYDTTDQTGNQKLKVGLPHQREDGNENETENYNRKYSLNFLEEPLLPPKLSAVRSSSSQQSQKLFLLSEDDNTEDESFINAVGVVDPSTTAKKARNEHHHKKHHHHHHYHRDDGGHHHKHFSGLHHERNLRIERERLTMINQLINNNNSANSSNNDTLNLNKNNSRFSDDIHDEMKEFGGANLPINKANPITQEHIQLLNDQISQFNEQISPVDGMKMVHASHSLVQSDAPDDNPREKEEDLYQSDMRLTFDKLNVNTHSDPKSPADVSLPPPYDKTYSANRNKDKNPYDAWSSNSAPKYEDTHSHPEPRYEDSYSHPEPRYDDSYSHQEPRYDESYSHQEPPYDDSYSHVEPRYDDSYSHPEPKYGDTFSNPDQHHEDRFSYQENRYGDSQENRQDDGHGSKHRTISERTQNPILVPTTPGTLVNIRHEGFLSQIDRSHDNLETAGEDLELSTEIPFDPEETNKKTNMQEDIKHLQTMTDRNDSKHVMEDPPNMFSADSELAKTRRENLKIAREQRRQHRKMHRESARKFKRAKKLNQGARDSVRPYYDDRRDDPNYYDVYHRRHGGYIDDRYGDIYDGYFSENRPYDGYSYKDAHRYDSRYNNNGTYPIYRRQTGLDSGLIPFYSSEKLRGKLPDSFYEKEHLDVPQQRGYFTPEEKKEKSIFDLRRNRYDYEFDDDSDEPRLVNKELSPAGILKRKLARRNYRNKFRPSRRFPYPWEGRDGRAKNFRKKNRDRARKKNNNNNDHDDTRRNEDRHYDHDRDDRYHNKDDRYHNKGDRYHNQDDRYHDEDHRHTHDKDDRYNHNKDDRYNHNKDDRYNRDKDGRYTYDKDDRYNRDNNYNRNKDDDRRRTNPHYPYNSPYDKDVYNKPYDNTDLRKQKVNDPWETRQLQDFEEYKKRLENEGRGIDNYGRTDIPRHRDDRFGTNHPVDSYHRDPLARNNMRPLHIDDPHQTRTRESFEDETKPEPLDPSQLGESYIVKENTHRRHPLDRYGFKVRVYNRSRNAYDRPEIFHSNMNPYDSTGAERGTTFMHVGDPFNFGRPDNMEDPPVSGAKYGHYSTRINDDPKSYSKDDPLSYTRDDTGGHSTNDHSNNSMDNSGSYNKDYPQSFRKDNPGSSDYADLDSYSKDDPTSYTKDDLGNNGKDDANKVELRSKVLSLGQKVANKRRSHRSSDHHRRCANQKRCVRRRSRRAATARKVSEFVATNIL